jgi:hypothetical protein
VGRVHVEADGVGEAGGEAGVDVCH